MWLKLILEIFEYEHLLLILLAWRHLFMKDLLFVVYININLTSKIKNSRKYLIFFNNCINKFDYFFFFNKNDF